MAYKPEYIFGLCYHHGTNGLEKDYAQALKWFTISANQGNSDAQYILGSYYYHGDGVEKDAKEGIRWWILSANQGHSDAQDTLSKIYFNGNVVGRDYDQAMKWYCLSVENKKVKDIKDVKALIAHEQCTICLENKKCIVFTCGHLCTCNSCSMSLVKCPLCRADITGKQVVYL